MSVRVVVTGAGLVSPLGVGVAHNWSQILAGRSAVQQLTDPRYSQFPCRVAACVPEGPSSESKFDWSLFTSSDRRQMSRGIAFALLAAEEAWKESGLAKEKLTNEQREKYGVAFGMGMADLDDIHQTGKLLDEGKPNRVSPYFVPRILTNMAAGRISIKYGLMGPNHSVSTACTTGAHSIGDAFNFIRNGWADVMICGGSDACVSPIALAGFSRCRALSTSFNSDPASASRPFDKRRDGFVMGEGAGALVLESLAHALDRGAEPMAELLGYGVSGDAFHMTAPDENGRGARLCMKRALLDAGVEPSRIGYVNAHATSTPLGDKIESLAVRNLLAGDSHWPAVSSTKGAVGHLLGAAGAVETVFTIFALKNGRLPPTINLDETDIDLGLNYVPLESIDWIKDEKKRFALTNSFGFGGTNASLCFASFEK